jgi:virulence-associated protein VagC
MSATAKLFMHGRSQAVRLPKEFHFEGKEVRVSRVGDKVVLSGSHERKRRLPPSGQGLMPCETAKICFPKAGSMTHRRNLTRANSSTDVLPRHQHRDFVHQSAASAHPHPA